MKNMMKWNLRLLAFMLGLVLVTTAFARQPNVVFVLTDDQGYGDMSCNGNTMIRTPNMDAFYKESVRLQNYHVDPTCSPSRSAILTGRYSTRVGVWHTIMGRSLMYQDETTLADIFKANKYQTAIFGKWHLGDNYPMRPQDRGFEEVLVLGGGGIGQTPDYWGNDYFDDTYMHNGKYEKFKGYCTDVWVDSAIHFIEKNKSKPFFLYLPVNVAHGPYNCPPGYAEYYLNHGVSEPMASFYGMIEHLDGAFGRLRKKLKELNLEENTILVLTTDNGTAAGAGRQKRGKGKKAGPANESWPGYNAGMRGAKGSPYEGGHRVPFFIRWPAGGIGGGKDVNQLTAHFDILPTLVEMASLKHVKTQPLDGISMVPLLKGDGSKWPDRTLFVQTQREEIPPKWKNSAALTEQWRMLNGKELYDIKADPGQAHDVAAQHPEVMAKLKADYEKWWASVQPSLKRYGWIDLGAKQDNPTTINCMDWHADQPQIPWNQPMVDKLPIANGYWMVEVVANGTYEFTLRHKPVEANQVLQATMAKVRVGDVEGSAPVLKGATSVPVKLKLSKGQYKMQTWLQDAVSGKERGAFFVEVKRLN